jgi:DNA polymerase III delta subunit
MPKVDFSSEAIPAFAEAPSVVLVIGDVGFFVEEKAGEVLEKLGESDAEILRFDDEATADAVSDSILNRSLFSPRRVVTVDIGRLLGTDSPAVLLGKAVAAWDRGTPAGRREAFRHARAVLSALDLSGGGEPVETADAAAKKTRRKEDAAAFAGILRELPEEKGGGTGLQTAIRLLLERGNDGTIALLTATDPPAGGLLAEIERKGLVLDASVGTDRKDPGEELLRLARARAKEREVSVDADALQRLLAQTDFEPATFVAELEKLLEIAGTGGRVAAEDVRQNVEDAASEDLYPFYDAIGRRDAADALTRLARLFSDRPVRAGERPVDTDDNSWPFVLLGMVTREVRNMLLVREALGAPGAPGFDRNMPYPAFQARVLPRLAEPVPPFGRSPFAGKGGQASGYFWYKAAQRASRYTVAELARALAGAAQVDVELKNSIPPLEAFTAWIGRLLAGR